MPKGLLTVKWDEVTGPEIVGKYPENLVIKEDDILRLFTTHAVGDEKERYLYMSSEDLKFSTYYTKWEDTPYLGVLILTPKENPEEFKDILPIYFSRMVEEIGEGEEITEALQTTFEEILNSISYSEEQKIFLVFFEPVGVQIFKLLTEGAYTSEEIIHRLEDSFGKVTSMVNFDHYTSVLKGARLVKEDRIAGILEPVFFLVRDVVLYRDPPIEVIKRSEKLPKEVKDKYVDSVKEFFENYEVDEEDNALLAITLLDNKFYEVFKKLREDCYSYDELIEVLQMEKEEFEEILSTLESLNIAIRFFGDEKTYVLLKTDFKARTFKPEYMINKVTEALINGRIDRDVAIEHLKLLKKEIA